MAEPLGPSDLSVVVINLMKGPVYRDTHEKPWALLLELRSQVSDYVSVLGLQVVVDESEGYAYLRSLPVDDGSSCPGWSPGDPCPSTPSVPPGVDAQAARPSSTPAVPTRG